MTTLSTEPRKRTTVAPEDTAPDLRVTMGRNALLEALRFVKPSLPGHPPMQVLLGVLLDATAANGTVRVSAYDYETSREAKVSAPGATGRALVPGRMLIEMVRLIPKGADVIITTDGNDLHIAGADVRYSLPTMLLSDYPVLPNPVREQAALTGNSLAMLARVGLAAGRDDTMPVLTGVHLSADEDGMLTAAATDRYRLAVGQVGLRWDEDVKILIPGRFVKSAAASMGAAKRVVLGYGKSDSWGGGLLSLHDENRRMTTRLLEGEFPKYRSLIPDEHKYQIQVPRLRTIEAVEQARVAVNMGPLRVEVDDSSLLISGGDPSPGMPHSTATVTGVKVLEGKFLDVALSDRFLSAGLLAVKGDDVIVSGRSATQPHIFQGTEDLDFLYLLMPVRMVAG